MTLPQLAATLRDAKVPAWLIVTAFLVYAAFDVGLHIEQASSNGAALAARLTSLETSMGTFQTQQAQQDATLNELRLRADSNLRFIRALCGANHADRIACYGGGEP